MPKKLDKDSKVALILPDRKTLDLVQAGFVVQRVNYSALKGLVVH